LAGFEHASNAKQMFLQAGCELILVRNIIKVGIKDQPFLKVLKKMIYNCLQDF
jgi:hypothetical protein